jgi:predicted transcriptional regulator
MARKRKNNVNMTISTSWQFATALDEVSNRLGYTKSSMIVQAVAKNYPEIQSIMANIARRVIRS